MKLQRGVFSTLSLLPFWGCVLGGQIPMVNGVIGSHGLGHSETINFKTDSQLDQQVLKSSQKTPGKLRGVIENSGVCETTEGVFQASGYADLTKTDSIWFWFFAARNKREDAPLVLWFNGGPGSSSMIGLFQENGPCRITNDTSSVTLNPYSWNNEANVLYIDQPVGAGFSNGKLNVGTSDEAAVDVWTFMQIFLSDHRFAKYSWQKLAIWTESYGGHYGPAFARYFLSQNLAIIEGKTTGLYLNLQVLGIGNGLTDPLVQYPGYISYAASNPYHPLVNQSVIDHAKGNWSAPGTGCHDRIVACNNGGSDEVCSVAQDFCNSNILGPLVGDYDIYYVLSKNPDPYPPKLFGYLNKIATTVGAEGVWVESNYAIYDKFSKTGDWMRTSRPHLEALINAGIRTIIFDGDADYIVNYKGVEAMVDALNTKFTNIYRRQKFALYSVDGQVTGQYKNAGTFSYLRIYGSGHQVPAYKYGKLDYGQAAAQFFNQIMRDESLYST